MKTTTKITAILLALLFFIQTPLLCAAATVPSDSYRINEYVNDNWKIVVEDCVCNGTITQTATFYENDILVGVSKWIITPDNTMTFFHNGELISTESTNEYDKFLSIALGMTKDVPEFPQSLTRAYSCGYSATHTHVETTSEKIDIDAQTSVITYLANLLAKKVFNYSGDGLNLALPIARKAIQTYPGTKYIKVTQTKYYVHNIHDGQDANCYHTFIEYLDASNNRLGSEWKYGAVYI